MMGKKKMNNEFEHVFVYGSLKKGFGNHRVVENQKFVGEAKTSASNYAMISLGAFPAVCKYEDGMKISGEIYKVNRTTMRNLDTLEGNGRLYTREKHEFVLRDGSPIGAWIYIMPMQVARSVFTGQRVSFHSVQKDEDSLIWL